MLALQLYEQSLCLCGCGYPREVAWDDDNDGWFTVDDQDRICYARRALDMWRDEQGPDPDREPGSLGPSILLTRTDGAPLT